jgi:hypothetical protein
MAAFVIPTLTGPETTPQVLRVTLDGEVYQLAIRYNERAAMWRMDIRNDSGTALASGLSLRNAGLPANLCVFRLDGLPKGLLLASPTTTSTADAGLEELGGRVLLTYQQTEVVY